MAKTSALINKETLLHICNSKQVSSQYLVTKGRFNPERLTRWMDISDSLLPTILQAKKLASCLHIPFAGLYMNPLDIPLKKIPSFRNMRTLWGTSNSDDSALNIAIIDLLSERDFLLTTSLELGDTFPTFSAPFLLGNDITLWATEIRKSFSIDLNVQCKCTSARQFYLYLRGKIEEKGIFVQCFTDVLLEEARGLAICDGGVPIIGVNDDDRPPAKSFTIIHELVHILKRESTLCNDMLSNQAARQEEVFCNAVAGEFLVPRKALTAILKTKGMQRPYSLESIAQIANRFSVSREVIVRRLLDNGFINDAEYYTYFTEFQCEIDETRELQRINRKRGINTGPKRVISREAFDRTSQSVCKVLYNGYLDNIFSKRDIAQHLNIDQKHIDKFLVEVSKCSK